MRKSAFLVIATVLILALVPLFAAACGEEETQSTTTTAGQATTTTAQSTTTSAQATTTSQAKPNIEPVELSLASLYPATAPPAQSLDRWIQKVSEASNGLIKIRHFTDNTLVAAPDMRTGVEAGTADLGHSFIYKPEPGFEPSLVLSQLILGLNYENCLKIFDDIWNQFPEMWAGQWEKFKLLWITVIDPNLLFTVDKPVRKMEDIKGLQIRMPSKTAGDMLKALGAAPVSMSTADWVVSLDKHTTDGAATSIGSILDHKVGPKLKYLTRYSTGPGVCFLIMNKKKYESLPPELQKVLDETAEWGKQDFIQAKKDAEKQAYEYVKSCGMEVIDLSPEEYARWDAAVQPVFDQIAADLNKAGFPGTELVKFALERAKFYQSQQ